MPRPRISVVLPVFNGEKSLQRAIVSIRRQVFTDWELLVVDDGSTDGSSALVQAEARTDSRLRYVRQPHSGIAAALTRGLAEARGELIARMDADDESAPERLAEQASYLSVHPLIGLVGSLVRFGGARDSAGGYAQHVDWINSLLNPESIALNRFVESPFAHPSVMFRSELAARFGGYREGPFPEDYELWLRWLDAGVRMAKVTKELLTWHDRPERLSRTDPRYDPEAFYRCKAQYLARWLKGGVDERRPILVWGAGRPTRRRAGYLETHDVQISGYIDIDPRKIGRVVAGRSVIGPNDLPPAKECFILGYVAKWGARDLARAHLKQRGYVEGTDFLMAA